MGNIKKNIGYNLLYRLVLIILPLITSPYIARTLGAYSVGVYSFTNSVAYYFFLFSMLGVNNYGNREIAKVRDDKVKLSETFWQIYYMQWFLSIIMTIIYITGVMHVGKEYLLVSLLQSLCVISAATDINWFAYGLEEFRFSTFWSSTLKIITALCYFIFIKQPSDLWKYTFILQFGNIVSLLPIWILVKQYTIFQKPNFRIIRKHIRPNLILFLPLVASSLYQYMDRIMIGLFTKKDEVGYYNYAENILSIPVQLTAAVGTVMLPHISNLVVTHNKERSIEILFLFLKYVSWLNIGLSFGMAAVAKTFIPWYLGSGFQRSAQLLAVLCPVIVINGIADVLRTQYLIPNSRDTLFTVSICAGALLNLLLNIVLIPKMFGMGASIATIAAYFSQLIIQIFKTKNELNYSQFFREIIPFVISGFVMYLFVSFLSKIISQPLFVSLLIQVSLGGILYFVLTMCWMYFVQHDQRLLDVLKH